MGIEFGASKNYAKSGGRGGSSPDPKKVAFYIYKSSPTDSPYATCFSGHDVSRGATYLGSLDDVVSVGNCADLVSGGTFPYDGTPHRVTVSAGKLSAESDGEGALGAQADGADSGTIDIGGVEVNWSVAYYDEAGAKLASAPVKPGCYAAVVTFTSANAGYCDNWIEQVTITKRQVPKPEPKQLVFECADWQTGEGALQDAFEGLDEEGYTFVEGAKAADGISSTRSARAAGSYQACFKLKDPATCQWEGESEDAAEVWVPWSIALAPFDPNDKEITYWGTAHDKATTTVAYTGEPVWVRPWFTPTKDTNGKFPEWLTHWGAEGRPTTNRQSAAVVYLKGQDDREGLVGYHTNADGSLEKVTAEQFYAWMLGVEVGGKVVAVKSGQKVWYKTDKEGWKVPLAVGGKKPKGAKGYVVARDLAWVDRLGVMDAGAYTAYAYFDEGVGFAPIALAEASFKVTKAKNPMSAKGKKLSSPAAKKTVYAKSSAFKLSKAKGAVTFKKVSGNKKITVNKKTGAVTVKAGLKKGKNYKVKVKVTAKGNGNYKKVSKTVTLKVKVK